MTHKHTRLRLLEAQVRRVEQRLASLRPRSNRYSWVRVGIFFGGLGLSILALSEVSVWLFWVVFVLTIVVFGLVVHIHRRIDQSIAQHTIWREMQHAQIARMRLDWSHIPPATVLRPRYEHPFEGDLDIVGEYALHRLLDTSVSSGGSERLRAWLTTSVPSIEVITERQALVRELTPLVLFRNKLTLRARYAANTTAKWDAAKLTRWLERPAASDSLRRWLVVLSAFIVLNLTLVALNAAGLIGPMWQVTFVVYLGLLYALSRMTSTVFNEATALQDALQQLRAIFGYLETYSYRQTPRLKALCRPFLAAEQRPSRHLAQVARIVIAAGLRANPLMWFVLNLIFPWDIFFAYRLQQRRIALAQQIPTWMDVWFELEALLALANFAYLNPSATFPTVHITQAADAAVLDAQHLGHPLIHDEERVCNDVAIQSLGDVALITGSNMSGKSTFLRTVGINLALAYAGGPVHAQQFQTRLFRLFTSIRVSDSVIDGISYFYAEVKRLKALLTALDDDHPLPLFFCIDEIFRGTNNRERLIGSRAYIRELGGKHGVGLISTHDLELVRLADEMPVVTNYHFRDDVVDGQMVFDYILHPGPSPTTNALKLMQLEGLPVDLAELKTEEGEPRVTR